MSSIWKHRLYLATAVAGVIVATVQAIAPFLGPPGIIAVSVIGTTAGVLYRLNAAAGNPAPAKD